MPCGDSHLDDVSVDIDGEATNDGVLDDVRQNQTIKTRRGQRRFRNYLLAAYRRRCPVTGSFVVELLEAAHIIPHSEITDYSPSNGILLRADIHTLYDLNLLTIDSRYRVRISKTLRHSEYWMYDGKQIAVPDKASDLPSASALEQRWAAFQAAGRDQ